MFGKQLGCIAIIIFGCLFPSITEANESRAFNKFVLKAVSEIYESRKGGGYDIRSYFSHNLKYGEDCCINANNPPKTMCVAAVAEVIVHALNHYSQVSGDKSPFKVIPMKSWTESNRRSIRPYIFMYASVPSKGTVSGFERFSIGTSTLFSELEAGDFINFSRTNGTGHAAIFLSYIDKSGNDVAGYSEQSVAGFRYFSAQGKGKADAGFGYRWGYFSDNCGPKSAGKPRDCGILRNFLYQGYLFHPNIWPSREQLDRIITSKEEKAIAETSFGATSKDVLSTADKTLVESLAAQLLVQELPQSNSTVFDGITTD